MARIDDMEHEIGGDRLLHRRSERCDEVMGQLADESDGIDDDRFARHLECGALRLRVERGEQLVDRFYIAAGQPVEQRRLTRVRVSDECDGKGGLTGLPLRLASLFDLLQVFLQPGDARADDSAIELELRLTDSTLRTASCTTSLP